jgi:hypothetical protein
MEETLWIGTEELLQMHDISYPLFNLRQSTLYRGKGMVLLISLQEWQYHNTTTKPGLSLIQAVL